MSKSFDGYLFELLDAGTTYKKVSISNFTLSSSINKIMKFHNFDTWSPKEDTSLHQAGTVFRAEKKKKTAHITLA